MMDWWMKANPSSSVLTSRLPEAMEWLAWASV
jgi:hypothetical protein